ncbi:putative phosphoglycerate mutase [Metarhizium anisopliae]|nr:putative phosphoglycerate mutase [Metarhizium anisopliae]
MSNQDAKTPRVYLVRHGETEWAKLGKFTGTTDIELTPVGRQQIRSAATMLVGAGKFLDTCRISHIFLGWMVEFTESIAEWDYGEYEGRTAGEIKELRKEKGLDQEREWSIWRDGCEGGESMQQVTERLDELISRIREIQRPYMNGEKPVDVVLVSHGLILRSFVKRWLNFAVDSPLSIMLDPGAIAVLSYQHNNVDEPAFHAGMALPPAKGWNTASSN